MSARPTEPGFYWARVAGEWEPVQFTTKRHPKGDVYVLQDHRAYDPDDIAEWGARIEREPGELRIHTDASGLVGCELMLERVSGPDEPAVVAADYSRPRSASG